MNDILKAAWDECIREIWKKNIKTGRDRTE